MFSEHNRFVFFCIGIIFIFTLALSILRPCVRTNEALRSNIQSLQDNIANLYQSEPAPSQSNFSVAQQKRQNLQTYLDTLIQTLDYLALKNIANYSTSVVEFRGQVDERLRQIRLHANKIGVSLNDSMGFTQPLPNIIPEHYWIYWMIGFQTVEQILTLAESQRQLYRISSLDFPKLDKVDTNEQFLQEYSIEITLEGSYSFIIQAIHNLSMVQPKTSHPFLSIQEAHFSTGTQSETIQAKISFSFLKLNPQGTLPKNIEEKNNNTPQTTPLWERY